MKQIIAVDFVNFKAFYDKGASNRIAIPQGNHVLIYGENGSGKSSIYEGLRQFFHSINDSSISPARNIHSEAEAEVAVRLSFSDGEEKIFPHSETVGTDLSNAALLNGFLSYKELLKTYLMNPDDFVQQFTYLFIEEILGKNTNSSTGRTFKQEWDNLFRPKANKSTKEAELADFVKGLSVEIQRINLILNEVLMFFDPHLHVKILHDKGTIEYDYVAKVNAERLYPEYNIWLEVKLFGKKLADTESHLTILNEARLSALSLAIYLSALINTEQSDFEYKILALDDIFIGLDMGNRLPLLRILSEFKKPKFAKFVQENGGIAEMIKTENGEKQYESTPFFDSYQIFMTTYDRNWFEVAKDWFEHKAKDKWAFFEMYVDDMTHDFDVPAIIANKTHLEKAEYYLIKHDYPACGMYLRKECEKVLSHLLKPAYRINEVQLNDKTQNYTTEQRRLNDLILNFKDFCEQEAIDYTDFEDLGIYKDALLNPLSHNDINSPIFKAELLTIIAILHKLKQINIVEVPNTQGKEALLIFNDTYSAEIKLREKILLLHQNGQKQLMNVCKIILKSTRKESIETTHNQDFDSLQEVYTFLCEHFGIACNVEDMSHQLLFRGKKLQDMITEI